MTEASTPTIPPDHRTIFWKFCQMICYIVTAICFDLKAYGKKNVPSDGGVLLLANHQSFLDPVLVGVKLNRAVSFLARSTLWKGPFGKLITALNAFPVKQGRGDLGAMKQSIAILQAGRALLVFPEGTRTKDGEMEPLASGISLLIRRAKVPVVPVAIDGAYHAWPRSSLIFKPSNDSIRTSSAGGVERRSSPPVSLSVHGRKSPLIPTVYASVGIPAELKEMPSTPPVGCQRR